MRNSIIFGLAVMILLSCFSFLVITHEVSHLILAEESYGVCFGTEDFGRAYTNAIASNEEEHLIWFVTSIWTLAYLIICLLLIKVWREDE